MDYQRPSFFRNLLKHLTHQGLRYEFTVVLVTRSDEPGVDYEYEIVLPDDSRYADLALAPGMREVYD